MVLLCKQKALYVKCCIIANGITDSQGDTLYAEDIKKIFTSFNNQDNFEVYHNDIPIQEVSLLENYISTADETIGTAVVPSGSWNAVIRVDNPEIQEALLTGEFKGVSLNNRIAEPCKANLTGQVRYQDIADAECIIPLLISFVEAGANGYGLHVMDYNAYIKKSKDIVIKKNGAKIMDFKEFIDGLKSLIKQAEDTPEEEPAVEKEDDETKKEDEEPVVEKAEEETTEEEATEEEAEIKKEDKAEEEVADEEEEAEIEKEDSDLEARVAKLEEQLAELLKEDTDAENPDPTVEPEDEDTPKITKSEKVVITNESEHVTQTNYYEMTGRDPVTGKKLR
jgi:chemotaxis protein histidine kinase CheA